MATQRKRPNADERFRGLIDAFNLLDELVKDLERERDAVRKKIRNIVKLRGRGVHNGNNSSINAYDVKRKVLNNDRVREIIGDPKKFAKCFKESKYIQVDGGPLAKDPEPNLGPAEVMVVQGK